MSNSIGPDSADAAQDVVDGNSEEFSELADESLKPDDGDIKNLSGEVVSEGTSEEAIRVFNERKSQNLKRKDIIPNRREVAFPEERNRLVAEFYGALEDGGGLQAAEDDNLGNRHELEKLGALRLEEKDYSTTPMLDDGLNNLFCHEGGKYTWLGPRPQDKDEILESVVTENRDGRRIDALHFMDQKTVDPEALEQTTGVNARKFLHELDRHGCVEFSREGVETSSRGQKLTHLMDETYELMTSTSADRAEAYLELADKASEYEDHPVFEQNSIDISGHRELIGRYIEKARGEIPEQLQAFEDYTPE